MTLIIGQNTYVSEAEADTYLAQSIRAITVWAPLATSIKEAALISARRMLDPLSWAGAEAALLGTASVSVNAGGAGYVVGDILTLAGGAGVAATCVVSSVAAGVVDGVQLTHLGFYSVDPTPLTANTITGGTGSGCTLDVVMYAAQAMDWPRAGIADTTAVDIPQAVKDAQCELAYELSQDPDMETAQSAGGDNVKRVKAGSVEVEKFNAQAGTRFPRPVMSLLFGLLESTSEGGATGIYAGGVDGQGSCFGDTGSHDVSTPWR